GGVQEIAAAAAVLLRRRRQQEARLAGLGPDLARHLAVLLPLRVVGLDLARDEAAHAVAIGLVVGGEDRPRDHAVTPSLRAAPRLGARLGTPLRGPNRAETPRRGAESVS